MSLNVQLHSDDRSWNDFVVSHPGSTNYHRYGWREVIERSFGHKTYYLVARNDEDVICGVLPLTHMKSGLFGNFLVSLPYFNYGGLLCSDEDAGSALLNRSLSMLNEVGATHTELRHYKSSQNGLATKQHKVTMILNLEANEELQWKGFLAKVRNQVRKAEKYGLQAHVGHMDLLDSFYEVFCRNMRDLGTPVYGKKFFKNILETFPDSTGLISIVRDDTLVASGFLTWYRNTLEVPWASSIRDFKGFCPNNLLYWEAIKFAIGNGSTAFDFGRSTPDEGTYRFKKQWGARPEPLYWQYQLEDGGGIPELNPSNPKYARAVRIWQRLPLFVANRLGPRIVRNIP